MGVVYWENDSEDRERIVWTVSEFLDLEFGVDGSIKVFS